MLIVDCWWGWLDADFLHWLKATYPWIRLIFVPPSCTPIGQPMDAGVIAKVRSPSPSPSPSLNLDLDLDLDLDLALTVTLTLTRSRAS